jgi:arginase family enzyme
VGPLDNVEYGLDATKLLVSDYGNVYIDGQDGKGTLEELIDKLEMKVRFVRGKGNTPLIIGGTHDASLGCLRVLPPASRVITVIPCPDVQTPFDGDKPSATSVSRLQPQHQYTYFAVDRKQLSKNDDVGSALIVDMLAIRRR